MKESLYSYIDPGIIHFMIYPETINGQGPILETLKKIAIDDFFTAVELTWIKDDEVREKAKEILETSHMKVYYGAQPPLLSQDLDLNSFQEKEREKAVDEVKKCVDEAVEINAEAVAFLSGKNVEDNKKDKAIALLVDSIKEICKYAQDQDENLQVVLEVFDDEVNKKALVGPASTAAVVAERVKKSYNNFGLLVDLSHLPLLGETPVQAIRPIKEHLVHVHIGNGVIDENSPLYGDNHPRFGVPAGENDVAEVVEFLKYLMEIGYLDGKESKTVSFEVKPLENESSEVVMANSKRVLKKAWAKL